MEAGLNIEIKVNPCSNCCGDCAECIHYSETTAEDIQESKAFWLRLEIDMRKRKEVSISI